MEKGLSKSRNDVKKSPLQSREEVDVWSYLPQEVVRLVFTKLNAESLYNSTFICKSWSQVARDKKLIQVNLEILTILIIIVIKSI